MAKSRKNKWSLVTFKEIATYIETNEIAQLTFAKQIDVTNSTFHNWKAGKSVPDAEKQLAIAKVIGKSVTPPPSAKGTETLDDLMNATSGSRSSGAQASAKKKTKTRASKKKKTRGVAKKVKKTKKAKAKKKTKKAGARADPVADPVADPAATGKKTRKKTRRAKKTPALNGALIGNGQGTLTERAYLVGRFMDARGVKTVEEFGSLIQTVTTALD